MSKKIKMIIYGEPGVGKSTFAFTSPKPFFITTDGNYDFLEDYGALEEDHRQVTSWAEFKNVIAKTDFSNYDTIVVDLLEDLGLWADQEFCKKLNIDHLGDLGFGKAYNMVDNEIFIEVSKLLALPKNIILLMHGSTSVLKDRRGIEYTAYKPASGIREKLLLRLEGRVQYFLRAYAEVIETTENKLETARYLSLSPDGKSEFGIARSLGSDAPRYIDLNWNVFYDIATKVNVNLFNTLDKRVQKEIKTEIAEKILEEKKPVIEEIEKPKKTTKKILEEKSPDVIKSKLAEIKSKDVVVEDNLGTEVVEEVKVETPKTETKVEEPVKQSTSSDDRLAAIRAKLAAVKAGK